MRSGRREFVVALLAVAGLSVAADTRPSRYRIATDNAGASWIIAPDGTRMLSKGVDCTGPGVEREA